MNYKLRTTTAMDVGFLYTLSSANSAGQNASTSYILDQETILGYASIKHEIIPHLLGTVNATIQDATYNGGGPGVDGTGYLFYELGFDLAYQFTPNLAVHAGYNYDNQDSDLAGETYQRNRVYFGVTGTY